MGSNPALDISYISQTGGAVSLFRRFVAGLSPQTPGFNFRSVYLGFLVDRVALGQIFSPRALVSFGRPSFNQCSAVTEEVLF